MKRIAGSLSLLLLIFLLSGVSVFAANNRPGNVKTLKATAGEKEVKLSWSGASKATGYYVYRIDGSKLKKVGTTKKKQCVIKKLALNKTYKFKVIAYRKVGKKTYTSAAYSPTVQVKTKAAAPAKPGNVKVVTYGSNALKISWSKAKNATGYEVYRVNGNTEKRIVALTGTSYTHQRLSASTTYTYKVRSYRKVGSQKVYSAFSAKVSKKPFELSAEAASVRTFAYDAVTKNRVVVQNLTTGKSQILEKNTQVAAAAKSGSSITAWLNNGDKIRISSANLKYQKGTYRRYADEQATRVLKETYNKIYIDSKSDYTTAAKEEYINSLSLSSPTKYLVWISQYRARVNIFEKKSGKWKLIRSFPCMIGRSGSQKGIYSIRYKFSTGDHGGPSLQWTGSKPWEGNMFHPNFRGDLNGYKDISKNGVAHSGGCIRCTQTQLNWMYKNLKVGTTVYSY